MSIEKGPFCECVKTGFYFSLEDDDRVFAGDLFFDFAQVKFQARGIRQHLGKPMTICPKGERGPVALMALIKKPYTMAVRDHDNVYLDIEFTQATWAGSIAAHVEEWYGDRSVWTVMQGMEIAEGLVWRA